MAADLHIHVFEGIEENDLADFFSSTLGSKHFNLAKQFAGRVAGRDVFMESYDKVGKTPNIWIGEVSWLKAMVTGNSETFIPDPVQKVTDLIGENLPVLDADLERLLLEALDVHNKTSYGVTDKTPIEKFLTEHRGKKLFTVSW